MIPNLLRELDWQIKNIVNLSAPVFKKTLKYPEKLTQGFSDQKKSRYQYIAQKYDLTSWSTTCNEQEFIENLYVLDICDQFIENTRPALSLDIGSKNWSYFPALRSFTQGTWHGVEIDAHRRYWNMTTRMGYAKYMIQECGQCRYFPESLLNINATYSFITWFLPFVKINPLRYWGLPDRYFEPEKLLQHAVQLLAPNGQMLIVNQGDEEAEIQKSLLNSLRINARFLGELQSPFNPYSHPRLGWVVSKSL